MNGSEKKAIGKTYDVSSMKHVTRKFHVVVMQNNGKEMYKNVCCICKIVYYLLDLLIFFAILVSVVVSITLLYLLFG